MYNDPNFFYYNNPVNYGYDFLNYGNKAAKAGLFSRLKGIKWGDILNNTSRTLNVINQAIPVIYQVKPLFSNAKTMFKIANIIKSDDSKISGNNQVSSKTKVSSFSFIGSTSLIKI